MNRLSWKIAGCLTALLLASETPARAQDLDPVCLSLDQTGVAAAAAGESDWVLGEHDDHLDGYVVSASAPRLLTWSYDGTVRVWDVGTRQEYRRFSSNGRVVGAEMSPDESIVAGVSGADGSYQHRVSVWDVASGELLHETGGYLPMDGRGIASDRMVVLDDIEDAETEVGTRTARLIELRSGRVIGELGPSALADAEEQTSGVWRAVLSDAGDRVLTLDSDNAIRLWAADTGAFIAQLGVPDVERSAAFTMAGQRIVTWPNSTAGARDARASLWDASTGEAIRSEFDAEASTLRRSDIAFSGDGRTLIARTPSGPAFWRAGDGSRIGPRVSQDGVVWDVFSPDGSDRAVVSTRLRQNGSESYSAQVFDTGQGVPLGPAHEFRDIVLGVEISPAGHQIIIRSRDGTAAIIDTETGEAAVPRIVMSGAVTQAFFLEHAPGVLIADLSGAIRLWSLETGQMIGPVTRAGRAIQELYWLAGHNQIVVEPYRFGNRTVSLLDMSWTTGAWDALSACLGIAASSLSSNERREALRASDAEFRALDDYVGQLAPNTRPPGAPDMPPDDLVSLILSSQTFPPEFDDHSLAYHPVDSLYYAASLAAQEETYRSVFWALVGAIRLQAHVDCRGSGPGSGDYALNAVAREQILMPIIGQMQGKEEALGAITGLALDWYQDQYDPAVPAPYCDAARSSVFAQNEQSQILLLRSADEE